VIALAPIVQPRDFYLEKHAWIWQAVLRCYHQRVPPDIATVADELRRQSVGDSNQLELVGGLRYLGELSAEVPVAVHGEYYARTVQRTSLLRQLIEAGGKVAALGYDERAEIEQTLDQAEQTVFAVTQRQRSGDFEPLSQVVEQYWHSAEVPTAAATPTGLIDLDRQLNSGMQPGNLVILAARPSVGKSALAQSIAYHVAMRKRLPVGLVTLEMNSMEITDRLIAIHTGMLAREVRQRLHQADAQVIEALATLHDAPLYIEQTPGTSVLDVRSKARRLAAQVPLALLIVDYLQLMVSSDAASRVEEVSQISRSLKLLAGELRCPVLALSQLSRAVEQRTSPIPRLSDLRDSGAIEQDADVVLFLHREELLDKNTDKKGVAEIYIAKQRNGSLGQVNLRFDSATMRFQNLAQHADGAPGSHNRHTPPYQKQRHSPR
jgi:replicative DNA helicase